MQVNEITQIDKILEHLDPKYHDSFCEAWYLGLDAYKEHQDSLVIMANATLAHWDIALYVVGVDWSNKDSCFVWKFGKNTSPDYV